MGQRGTDEPLGTVPGGRRSSAYAIGVASPKLDTFNGYSAPQTPGPLIGVMRTIPAPSRTAPDSRHCTSASCRHASRTAKKPPPLHPAMSAMAPMMIAQMAKRRIPHPMRERMRVRLLTLLQGLALGGAVSWALAAYG